MTKLKKIIQDAKENVIESDLRQRMQPLKEMLTNTINQLHSVLEAQVFVMVCRGFWDRMGQVELSVCSDYRILMLLSPQSNGNLECRTS